MTAKERMVHCLFEQSGTFKNAFKRVGIEARDYDILNDFGETDVTVDLFDEIKKAFCGEDSTFDSFEDGDLVFAFFPCTRFEQQIILAFKGQKRGTQNWSMQRKLEDVLRYHEELSLYYKRIAQLAIVACMRGLRLIIENPYNSQHYLTRYWPVEPKIIDMDRTKRGDHFCKPTQYWFINCDPKNHVLMDEAYTVQREHKIITKTHNKVERSMIAPEYADRFIREYIL